MATREVSTSSGNICGNRGEHLHLVLDGSGTVVLGQPVPGRPATCHPAAVGDDDDEPLLGEPLRGQVRDAPR